MKNNVDGVPPSGMPTGVEPPGGIDPIVWQCQCAFEEALQSYQEGNMFEYEKVCKQIHMRSLLKANQTASGDARMQIQKLMNQHFLKFQMKEKNIYKEVEKRKKLQDDFKVLK